MMLAAEEAYQDWQGKSGESILVQGVIDCMIEEEDGITLIDFKTDTIAGKFPGGFDQAKPILEERYKSTTFVICKSAREKLTTPCEREMFILL